MTLTIALSHFSWLSTGKISQLKSPYIPLVLNFFDCGSEEKLLLADLSVLPVQSFPTNTVGHGCESTSFRPGPPGVPCGQRGPRHV